MNTIPLKSPLIPYKLVIDNKKIYSSCLKRRYKYVNSLKMQYTPLNQRYRCLLKPMRRRLTKLAKTLKYSRNLCMRDFIFCAQDFRGKEILDIIKLFAKLQGLSLPILHSPRGQLKSNIFWLKYLKFLKKVSCINELSDDWDQTARSFLDIYKKFTHVLKTKKIESFELNLKKKVLSDIKSQRFTGFPSILKSLKINFEGVDASSFKKEPFSSWSFLNNMKHLRELYLCIPVTPARVVQILSSLPYPDRINSLGLAFCHRKKDVNYQDLEEILSNFRALERVALGFNSLPGDLKAFEVFSQCPLKCLRIDIHIQEESDVTLLANFISKFQHIEEFCLKLNWLFVCKEMENVNFLFDQIALMEKLKKIDLNFVSHEDQKHSVHFSRPFKSCLQSLSNLEEVAFEFDQDGISSQAYSIIQALQSSVKIRKLKINLQSEKMDQADFMKLLRACRSIKLLKELVFDKLYLDCDGYESRRFLDRFYQMENLKELRFLQLKLVYVKAFGFFVQEMMHLKVLREINCDNYYANMSQIRIENPFKADTSQRNIVVPQSSTDYIPIRIVNW